MEMLITVWEVVTGIEERGLGTLRDMLGLGLCAEGKVQEMRRAWDTPAFRGQGDGMGGCLQRW